MTRYPFAPVEFVAAQDSALALARRLDVNSRQVYRWRASGLTEVQADRLACALGLHPLTLWPNWMEDPVRRVCARARCDVEFVPNAHNQRFCSTRCQRSELNRRHRARRYARDDGFAEAERARARAYYDECRGYVLARQRRKRGAA